MGWGAPPGTMMNGATAVVRQESASHVEEIREHGVQAWEINFPMGEGASLKAKRDPCHEAEKFLRTNPIPGLRKNKSVAVRPLSCSTVNEEARFH